MSPEHMPVPGIPIPETTEAPVAPKIDDTPADTAPEESLASPMAVELTAEQEANKNLVKKWLMEGRIDDAVKIVDSSHLPYEVRQDIFEKAMLEHLDYRRVDKVIKILKLVYVSRKFFLSPKIRDKVEMLTYSLLRDGDFARACEFVELSSIGETVTSPMVKRELEEAVVKLLQEYKIDIVIKIVEVFHLSKKFLSSLGIQSKSKKPIFDLIREGKNDPAIKAIETFHWPERTKRSIAKKVMIEKLKAGHIGATMEIVEAFKLSQEFLLSSPEVIEAAREGLIKRLSKVEFDHLAVFFEAFNLKTESKIVKEVDEESAKNISDNYLLRFIPFLGDENITTLFPLTFLEARKKIFDKISKDLDTADYFVENLNNYYQQSWVPENVAVVMKWYSVAQKFIYAVENDQTVWKNEPWVADIFAKAEVIVKEHQDQFGQDDDWQGDSYRYSHGNEGFRETDPYENHPWRFTSNQMRQTEVLTQIFEGNADEKMAESLGINVKALEPILKYIDGTITNEVFGSETKSEIIRNPKISEEDKDGIIESKSGSVKLRPLISVMRSLVARYLVQELEDITILEDEEKIKKFFIDKDYKTDSGNRFYDPKEHDYLAKDLIDEKIRGIAHNGLQRFIQVLEVDVPLYDKLYEEFDGLRETGRNPLEVYLGRDGIYAYIGRRAQDVARRRKMGPKGRKGLKEKGEILEINPQYVVYPRYFRDNINYETKRQFLEQEGISPEADPLFYDTGYTGTIPEQIMRVMDFEDEDIEKRIRLLSAPVAHRRVKGITENARGEIIEYIEHNAKTEQAAEGLIINGKTGKIRHIAKPTSPEEQFYFMMVKQAIARHYWLKEKLHHEPSGNVNLDSEHYRIRIRQEYAELLPKDFVDNPKEFFAKHGEVLKSSKGEGKYPDEEILLFKLIDGTEIVAKRIELRKAKEARKEFAILIAAKKAGLPTAEPVGFLSGKEESDNSYLLMKKVEGMSGRQFEKELVKSGKYTKEEIKSIMQQVMEKNKEMADLFREKLKIDKRWRIKDTIIEFNEETKEVENVIPIDWERTKEYDPKDPKEIDEIE